MKKLTAFVAQLRLLPVLQTIGAAAFRIIPFVLRPPNMAPVGGFSLYGGARLPLWQALLLPMLAMGISDVVLRQIHGLPMFDPFVYASFLIYAVLGRLMLKDSKSWSRIIGVTVLGSVQFFLITNLGHWYMSFGQTWQEFPATFTGLMLNYVKALPYFAASLEGDLIFSLGFFALHQWVESRSPATIRLLLPQEARS
jgi:hypothetical protein